MAQLKLPIGIENFNKISTEGYYYVDKTDVIRQILEDGCFVTLFTRPRRFGKSLNMSMLRHFFEISRGMDLSGNRQYRSFNCFIKIWCIADRIRYNQTGN